MGRSSATTVHEVGVRLRYGGRIARSISRSARSASFRAPRSRSMCRAESDESATTVCRRGERSGAVRPRHTARPPVPAKPRSAGREQPRRYPTVHAGACAQQEGSEEPGSRPPRPSPAARAAAAGPGTGGGTTATAWLGDASGPTYAPTPSARVPARNSERGQPARAAPGERDPLGGLVPQDRGGVVVDAEDARCERRLVLDHGEQRARRMRRARPVARILRHQRVRERRQQRVDVRHPRRRVTHVRTHDLGAIAREPAAHR